MKHKKHVPTGFTLLELMVAVVIISVLVMVAVPVYGAIMRRSQTTEAILLLNKLYEAGATYFMAPRLAEGESVPKCRFPGDVGVTPDITALACCGGALDVDKNSRCDVDETHWTHPTWSGLNFELKDQHAFGYSVTTRPVEDGAYYTARANGDLDCDGFLSTFERTGFGSTKQDAGKCGVKTASGMYSNMPAE